MPKTDTPRQGFVIRKVPDTTTGERVKRFDPDTGEPKLVNPHTPGDAHEAWPLLGVQIENAGGPPALVRVPTSFVQHGRMEGWLSVTGETRVERPSGPAHDPWLETANRLGAGHHTFSHVETIVLHAIDGDVTYRVTRQPDKYVEGAADDSPMTDEAYAAGRTRVDSFYDAELEG